MTWPKLGDTLFTLRNVAPHVTATVTCATYRIVSKRTPTQVIEDVTLSKFLERRVGSPQWQTRKYLCTLQWPIVRAHFKTLFRPLTFFFSYKYGSLYYSWKESINCRCVFPMKSWHKECFKCGDCSKRLDSVNCCEGPDKDIYCKGTKSGHSLLHVQAAQDCILTTADFKEASKLKLRKGYFLYNIKAKEFNKINDISFN